MASSVNFNATATPGFQWSLPDQDPPTKPSPATIKPISNPLLANAQPSVGAAASSLRVPFSPVENKGLRQRRQQDASRKSTLANIPANGKLPVRPPTATFLMNGNIGVSNERAATDITTFESTSRESDPQLVTESLKRWVVVYGYTNESQYQAILHHFQKIGRVLSHQRANRRSNWVAFEYESAVQAEKALCQQNRLLMDGILIGVCTLTLPLKQSLEWNSTSISLSSLPNVASRLDTKFETDAMKEEDILLLASPEKNQSLANGSKRSMCERFLSWWFGW